MKEFSLDNLPEKVGNKSEIEYYNGQIIYENYDKLDKYLEEKFIPLHIKKRNGQESIRASDILRLEINIDEANHIFEYLKNKGIIVSGYTSDIDNDNYNLKVSYYNKEKLKSSTHEENYELVKKYKETKDIKYRNQLIENNMKLINYIAYDCAKNYGLNSYEYYSAGFFGLIRSLKSFDITKSTNFISYAYPAIKTNIKRAIAKELGIDTHAFFDLDYALISLSVEYKERVDIDDIYWQEKLLEKLKELNSDKIDNVKLFFTKRNSLSIESLDEIDIYEENDPYIDIERQMFTNQILDIMKTRLNDKQYMVLKNCIFDDKTYREIAQKLNITKAGVGYIYNNVMELLSKKYITNMFKEYYDSDLSIDVIEQEKSHRLSKKVN